MSRPSAPVWMGLPVLVLAACEAPERPGDDACAGAPLGEDHSALIIATASESFDGGALVRMDLDDLETCDVATATSDSVVTVSGGRVIDVGRLGFDRLRMYEPPTWDQPVAEFSVGEATNPQDVVRCGDAWWVSQLGTSELRAYDDDGSRLQTVELGKWADEDGLPEPGSLLVDEAGERLWVALQRLDRGAQGAIWPPAGPGVVLTIDCATGLITQEREVTENPSLARRGDAIVAYGQARIQGWTDGEDAPETLVELDQPVASAAFTAAGHGVVITREPDTFWHRVHCLSAEGELSGLLATASFLSDAVATDHDEVWLAARSGWADPDTPPEDLPVEPAVDAELWAIDPSSCTLSERVALELGPYSLDVY